uniref:Leucine-rich repeat family protein n=1 Tax=Rhizophora mucronata TaxID=61149 RepID=A0A2P2MVG1_RHIMU
MSWYVSRTSLFLPSLVSFLSLSLPIVFSQLSSSQTSIMIALSKHLSGSASHWNANGEPNPCLWKGVTCSSNNSTITHLSLYEFGLSTSDFLPSICQIQSLQSLDVSLNSLASIPDEFLNGCGGIDGLKLLNFSRNKLAGLLPTFHGFVGLEALDLAFNALSGNVNSQLDGLVALKSLNLSFNNFNGAVPVKLGNSMVLEELELSVNSFHGIIPPELGNYQDLSLIDLSSNHLYGSIPYAIGNLNKLKTLLLSVNNLSGEIPINISNITTLLRFAANQNMFNGTIPRGITNYLSHIDLSYNKLRGSIPTDLLSGPNLKIADLSYNMLEGSIPASISASLVRLRLGSNNLDGTIPSFTVLQTLTYLELDNNSLTNVIPAELGSFQSLALLNLAQNKLTGPLPKTLGNLRMLEVLKVQQNELDGEIPFEITQLHKLSVLNVSCNYLAGAIPSTISNLQSLSRLNLQNNKLNGSIPPTIRSMPSLLEVQLGHNQLSGRIPEMPLKLQIALNLSSNLFQGSIPTLSSLNELEVLDLSDNRFSGEIPGFLVELPSLTQLILSNNQLSGIIPEFKRWVSVDVRENPHLVNATNQKTLPEPTKKRKSVAVAVILAVVAAILVGGLLSFLMLSFSRCFPKDNDHQSQAGEDLLPQVIKGNLLTANGMHGSNIDFTKGIMAVADLQNIVLKTRFSTYYKATMPSGAIYFVKKLNWSDKIFQLGSHDKFEQELKVLGKLSNLNVMIPLAYVMAVDSAYLFYDYAQKGTLFDVLHGKLGNALDWGSRYSIAVGVAQGLSFLHGFNSSPILLLDLSSKNILLKSLKEPVVGDIELCKVIDPSKSTGSLSTVAGSVGYIPPGEQLFNLFSVI